MSIETDDGGKRGRGKGATSGDDNALDTPLAMSSEHKKKLRDFSKRVEFQETEKANLATDIGELNEEIEAAGLDFKLLRKVVKFKKKNKVEREHEQARFQFYLDIVGDD